ncbi:TATA box-binding protein-like 1 [Paramacrobiotus metropolitanus]|uniref:TATA box-binding protein-like 1 n=1 Tax=Paramacrobiotus metropolitanus TaxID=2943436 RepID=UPI0024457C0F|nr:TATA box-binding protein-like 1 [Paramacrobiotus metropolitanus]
MFSMPTSLSHHHSYNVHILLLLAAVLLPTFYNQGHFSGFGAPRRLVARKIQKCGFGAKFVEFKIINCLAVARLPFGVRIDLLKDVYPHEVQYEPELHPAASWKLPEVGGPVQVFQTGNTTITAPNALSARKTLASIYAKLYEFRKPKDSAERSVDH